MAFANREIGVSGFQPQVPTSNSEFKLITAVAAAVAVAAAAGVAALVDPRSPEADRVEFPEKMVPGLLAAAGSDWALQLARAAAVASALWRALRVRHRPPEHRVAAGARRGE